MAAALDAAGVVAAGVAGAALAPGAVPLAGGTAAVVAGTGGATAATGAAGTHGVAAVFVVAAGCFFFPKIEVMLEMAAEALETVDVAVEAAPCAAAEFVAPASAVAVAPGPQAGVAPPTPESMPLAEDASELFPLCMTAPGAVPLAPFVKP